MSQSVPLLNLKEQYQAIAPELESVVLEVLRSGNYILGQYGTKLETAIAEICGCKYGIGVANGTDALELALWALDIGPGDEVITSPFTFAATVEAINMRGAKAVFVDIHEQSYNIDPAKIEAAITPRTKAIMPVHLYGQPAAMEEIMVIAKRHNLRVVEDNAQAIGATINGKPTGSFGDIACISFYPTKNLGAAGDAGAIVTNDPILNERVRCLRAHGSKRRYYHEELGINSRLDEIQAAILMTKVPHLANWNDKRQQVADKYSAALQGVNGVIAPTKSMAGYASGSAPVTHVWHQYTIRVINNSPAETDNRDALIAGLSERGVGSMCYYPVPLHLQQAFADLGHKPGDFPITERLSNEVLSLPMYPELTEDQIATVASAITDCMAKQTMAIPVGSTQPLFTT